jgi:uncharacterized protein (DUF1684 family)
VSHWSLDLADYRRRVSENYASARRHGAGPDAWNTWRNTRDALLGSHPQSPLPEADRTGSWSTPFFEYDPGWRVTGSLVPSSGAAAIEMPHSSDGSTRFSEIGRVGFSHGGVRYALTLFWLDAYGGGLFLPFRDATAGSTTYGGGRYLLDTVKGADLGSTPDGELVLDFNYAYHPSCAWDVAWSCPLSPPSNHLDVRVEAGEQLPRG